MKRKKTLWTVGVIVGGLLVGFAYAVAKSSGGANWPSLSNPTGA
jgi:hypothetical protein